MQGLTGFMDLLIIAESAGWKLDVYVNLEEMEGTSKHNIKGKPKETIDSVPTHKRETPIWQTPP